jgi:hypothetical protein
VNERIEEKVNIVKNEMQEKIDALNWFVKKIL